MSKNRKPGVNRRKFLVEGAGAAIAAGCFANVSLSEVLGSGECSRQAIADGG